MDDRHGNHGHISIRSQTYEALRKRVMCTNGSASSPRGQARGIGALVDTIITTALDLEDRRREVRR